MIREEDFHINKLFKLQQVRHILSKSVLSDAYEYPAYSSDTTNNGIIGYTNNPEFICDKNNPVYITFGDHTRSMNIVRKSFSVLDNVKVLKPCIDNDNVLLYMITAWKKAIPDLGYARHWKVAKDCCISLPIQTDDVGNPLIDPDCAYHPTGYIPDWQYMQKYITELEQERITELEQERITELEQYLIATGLNDYMLMDEDIKTLSLSSFGDHEGTDRKDAVCVYKEFKIVDIFAVKNSKNILKSEVDFSKPLYPYVTAQEGSNSVMGYVNFDEEGLEEGNCIFIGGKTLTVSYQADSFFSNDSHNLLLYLKKDEHREEVFEYLASAVYKALKPLYSWNGSISFKKIQKDKLTLPIQADASGHPILDPTHAYHPDGYIPDWDFMEKYIRAIEKIVIKDVVEWKDKEIARTKEILKKE